MSDRTQAASGEQRTEQTRADELREWADWLALGKLLVGVVLGLAANALVVLTIIGGDFSGIAGGIAYLVPAAFIGAAVFHDYGPEVPYVGGLVLFLTILVAHTAALMIRMYQTPVPTGSPGATLLVVAVVGLIFTPGPFLGTWAVRRWWT